MKPSGYTCTKCGTRNPYTAMVYENWNRKLTHLCKCGAVHANKRGKTTFIEMRPPVAAHVGNPQPVQESRLGYAATGCIGK